MKFIEDIYPETQKILQRIYPDSKPHQEHDFSALKRARMYANPGTSLDEIIRDYCHDLMSYFYLK